MAPTDPLAPPAEANMDMDTTAEICRKIVGLGDELQQKISDVWSWGRTLRDMGIIGQDPMSRTIRTRYYRGASPGRQPDGMGVGAEDIYRGVRDIAEKLTTAGANGLDAVQLYRDAARSTVDGFHR